MLKITDSDFQLKEYIPLVHLRTLTSGRTAPLLMQGICTQTQTKDDIVLKPSGSIMSNDATCREILGMREN